MAIGFIGRYFLETAGRDTSIELLWDGQIYDLDVWVIPKTTTHMATALKFVSFAVQSDVMAEQARLLPYGPARRSAAQLATKHASLDIDLTNYVPTNTRNFKRALRVDERWWETHGARLRERFTAWAAGDTTAPEE